MKTKEEPNKLKDGVEVQKKFFSELHDNKLEQVTGGANKYKNYGEESIEKYGFPNSDSINEGEKTAYQYDLSGCSIRNMSVEPCPFSDDYRRLIGAEKNCNDCPRNPNKQNQ